MCLSWYELRTKQVEVRVNTEKKKLWETEAHQFFPEDRTESKISEFAAPAQGGVSLKHM